MHARHILIGESAPADNPFAPPQSGRDKARAAVEQEKQKKLLDEIVARSHVSVAENFTVKMPPPQTQQAPPGFGPGTAPPLPQPPAEGAKPKAGEAPKKPEPKHP